MKELKTQWDHLVAMQDLLMKEAREKLSLEGQFNATFCIVGNGADPQVMVRMKEVLGDTFHPPKIPYADPILMLKQDMPLDYLLELGAMAAEAPFQDICRGLAAVKSEQVREVTMKYFASRGYHYKDFFAAIVRGFAKLVSAHAIIMVSDAWSAKVTTPEEATAQLPSERADRSEMLMSTLETADSRRTITQCYARAGGVPGEGRVSRFEEPEVKTAPELTLKGRYADLLVVKTERGMDA